MKSAQAAYKNDSHKRLGNFLRDQENPSTRKAIDPAPSYHARQVSPLDSPLYRSDIDGLRAIAVLSVVGFHTFPLWARGGFIGVDIFFVISGFLISTIIFNGLKAGRFDFLEFYGRRIKRIFPALALILLASFAFGWFALFPRE